MMARWVVVAGTGTGPAGATYEIRSGIVSRERNGMPAAGFHMPAAKSSIPFSPML